MPEYILLLNQPRTRVVPRTPVLLEKCEID